MGDVNQTCIFVKKSMPMISMFYGIIVRMFYFDNHEHKKTNIYFQCGRGNAVIEIPSGQFIPGKFPSGKLKLVQAWIEIHKDK